MASPCGSPINIDPGFYVPSPGDTFSDPPLGDPGSSLENPQPCCYEKLGGPIEPCQCGNCKCKRRGKPPGDDPGGGTCQQDFSCNWIWIISTARECQCAALTTCACASIDPTDIDGQLKCLVKKFQECMEFGAPACSPNGGEWYYCAVPPPQGSTQSIRSTSALDQYENIGNEEDTNYENYLINFIKNESQGVANWLSYGTNAFTLSADVNNYSPGQYSMLLLQTDLSGNKNITGLFMNQVDGQKVVIKNQGSIDNILINWESSSSAAQNRFANPPNVGSDILTPGSVVIYSYSSINQRWLKIK